MSSRGHLWWRVAGVLSGLTGLSLLAAALIAVIIAPLILIGGGCGLYLGLHLR
jgi:hypothetical protein